MLLKQNDLMELLPLIPAPVVAIVRGDEDTDILASSEPDRATSRFQEFCHAQDSDFFRRIFAADRTAPLHCVDMCDKVNGSGGFFYSFSVPFSLADARDAVIGAAFNFSAISQDLNAELPLSGSEYGHRLNNLLAVIAATAARTTRDTGSFGDFLQVFRERLRVIGAAHQCVPDTDEAQVEVREIFERNLRRSADLTRGTHVLSGHSETVDVQAAISLSTMIQELLRCLGDGPSGSDTGVISHFSWSRRAETLVIHIRQRGGVDERRLNNELDAGLFQNELRSLEGGWRWSVQAGTFVADIMIAKNGDHHDGNERS